jgi:hypothetical protein
MMLLPLLLVLSTPVPEATCPIDVADLTPTLLRDLPSYANRVIARSYKLENIGTMSQVVTAGKAEFVPLPVSAEPGGVDPNLKQVFFTTLERQRSGDQMVELQQYHWLFLTRTEAAGWQLALSYSRTAAYPSAEKAVSPPRESSAGPIAQGVKLWLRDCEAGTIRELSRKTSRN